MEDEKIQAEITALKNLIVDRSGKSSIEITKNSRGYNWSFKIYEENIIKLLEITEEVKNKLMEMFPEVKE